MFPRPDLVLVSLAFHVGLKSQLALHVVEWPCLCNARPTLLCELRQPPWTHKRIVVHPEQFLVCEVATAPPGYNIEVLLDIGVRRAASEAEPIHAPSANGPEAQRVRHDNVGLNQMGYGK